MSDPRNPGPPLVSEKEFCACEPPTAAENLRATAAALVALLVGAALWLGLVLLLQKISSVTALLIAVGAGRLVHHAAGRHRSVALGILAGASSLLAVLCGFALLWLPLFDSLKLPRQLDWYQIAMMVLGALAAYHLAGPRQAGGESL